MALNPHESLLKMLVNVGKVLEQISHTLIVIQPLLVCADAYDIITLLCHHISHVT